MSQFRKDPITDRWVIIATERAAKPEELVQQARVSDLADCPFCEFHETDAPDEILAYRDSESAPNGPGWRVRVIPNKYPAVTNNQDSQSRGGEFYRQMQGYGTHEVIVECPQHETELARLSAEHISKIFSVYRDRLAELATDPQPGYALIFKNSGALAGASIEHCHSQLITTPILPTTIAEELACTLRFFQQRKRCAFCEMLERELADGSRVICETSNFVILCPYAARFAFEMWLLPKTHTCSFTKVSPAETLEAGRALKMVLEKLGTALNGPAYNYILHTSPPAACDLPHYHWHLEIFPRMAQLAGLEHGTGLFVNPLLPEHAADILREASGTNQTQ